MIDRKVHSGFVRPPAEPNADDIKASVDEFLEINPVTPGASAEEAAQIKLNTENIEKLQTLSEGLDTVVISDSAPNTDNKCLWIQSGQYESFDLPQINDETVSEEDTWSSKKISDELNAQVSQLSEEIANLSSSESGLSQTLRVAIYNLLMDAAYQSSGHETDKAALEELLTGSSGGESGGEGEEVIYYTIKKTLTNVTINNSATSVAAGSAYSATLTADEGYTLDSVTVTMGGEAVLVTDGIIYIASVTGNIVITATATNEESGNDPFAGTWTEGFRLQSNGTEYATGHPGYDTTDYVDCTNFSTVTISPTVVDNQFINAVVWYDDSKTRISGEGGKYVSTSNENYPSTLSFTKADGAAYCRICLIAHENFNISVE